MRWIKGFLNTLAGTAEIGELQNACDALKESITTAQKRLNGYSTRITRLSDRVDVLQAQYDDLIAVLEAAADPTVSTGEQTQEE